jgi:hypothetical protein
LTELDVVGIGREGLPTLDVTSGLKTLYWAIILVWVTLPVTSFLLRGGTYFGIILSFL